MIHLPEAFVQRLSEWLPSAAQSAFLESLQAAPITSLRQNPRKPSSSPWAASKAVPWCAQGLYLEERPVFTLDPRFWAGAYYVQEASSMFAGYAAAQVLGQENPVRALDLCAAPGGKSTHLSAVLPEGSLLVSNELIKGRNNILVENLLRWGATGSLVVSQNQAADFAAMEEFFDLILVDAPCSGEGMFRKEAQALTEWSPENVAHCALRQQDILTEILPALKEEGYLLYSTCTYNRQENEENIHWLLENTDMRTVPLPIEASWGIEEVQERTASGEKVFAYRFLPHRSQGEGFFLCCLQRTAGSRNKQKHYRVKDSDYQPLPKKQAPLLQGWLREEAAEALFLKGTEVWAMPPERSEEMRYLSNLLEVKYAGLLLGELKGKDFVPSPDLALGHALAADWPSVALSEADALQFLRKKELSVAPQDLPQGWVLVRFENLALGWLKVMPQRINNYYPAQWRVRM
jgi:16S rRNA C967 or C1407 C5-methylase (RsmB/RsmF family)/NOL1/NOP2/fmu family ribosome biogenesis protein